MIESNAKVQDYSSVEKGRRLLEQGDISSALTQYEKAFDPDVLDEAEARAMLIEARSHLSRKHYVDALECFEEALMMGTDRQRGQALEGIAIIGEIRARVRTINSELKSVLKKIFGKRSPASKGLALVSDAENVLLISREAVERLPSPLSKGGKIQSLPPHLRDHPLPLKTDKCIPFADDKDLRFLVEVIEHVAKSNGDTANPPEGGG
ncbi:MAG: tetratricopeptide repeat protein [Deltaproteobacteria bacterium]|nr:tetratricopeptide repeat protein [Deltaproteobacteria bacterium]